jgi:hypothetical protein
MSIYGEYYMESLNITNICGWRQHDLKCGYYPCSDGSPCGRCWALTDPNGCNRTKARDDLIAAAERDHDTEWFNRLSTERKIEEIRELTKPWRLDGK